LFFRVVTLFTWISIITVSDQVKFPIPSC
jgi:hypothetical protein